MTKTFLAVLFLAVATMAGTGRSAILAGWDAWADATTPYAPDVLISGFSSSISMNVDRVTSSFSSTSGTFGTVPGATTSDGRGLLVRQESSALTLTLSLANNSGQDYSLTSINFDFAPRTDVDGDGADSFTLTYTSGDLGPGGVTIGSQSNLPILINGTTNANSPYPGYDLFLSPSLTDTTLADGESAIFTLVFSGQDANNVSSVVDNVAFIGTPVPEPTIGSLLLALGLLAGVVRRRRR